VRRGGVGAFVWNDETPTLPPFSFLERIVLDIANRAEDLRVVVEIGLSEAE
jgi:hypothetical protein